MIDEAGGRCLAVRTSDANHLRVGIATSKLYLTDDADATLLDFYYHRCGIGNARTLDNLVSAENLLLSVLAFLPCYLMVVKHLLILITDFRHVADEHLETFFLSQDSSSCAALACS